MCSNVNNVYGIAQLYLHTTLNPSAFKSEIP